MKDFSRICFFLYNLDPGGLETYLIRFLKSQGQHIRSTVVLKSGKSGLLENEYKAIGTNLKFIKTGYLNVWGWWKILQLYRKDNYDAVVDLTGNFGGIYLFLARICGIKSRVAYYGLSSNHFNPTFFNLHYNNAVNGLVYRFATRIIANSAAALKYFFLDKNTNDGRFVVLPNGVIKGESMQEEIAEIRKSLGIPDNGFVLIHAGRNDPNKNHFTILRVVEVLCERHPNFFAILCGKDTEKLSNLLTDSESNRRILLLGYRKDIASLMNASNIFYFPSVSEGQPNALIEAILNGLPFVASDLEEIKEFLPEQYWDNLIHPMDEIGAIRRIESILTKEKEWNADSLKSWAEDYFNPEKRFNEFRKLILS